MKERPILFSGEMVRAILEGRKTMTRRVKDLEAINSNPDQYLQVTRHIDNSFIFWGPSAVSDDFAQKAYPNGGGFKCPYGIPGDRLWVKETWRVEWTLDRVAPSEFEHHYPVDYLAEPDDWMHPGCAGKWRPSIFMPRWASRITLEITNVRVERLQDITLREIGQEGWPDFPRKAKKRYSFCESIELGYGFQWFETLWDSINGKKYPWESDPFIWVIEFKRLGDKP